MNHDEPPIGDSLVDMLLEWLVGINCFSGSVLTDLGCKKELISMLGRGQQTHRLRVSCSILRTLALLPSRLRSRLKRSVRYPLKRERPIETDRAFRRCSR